MQEYAEKDHIHGIMLFVILLLLMNTHGCSSWYTTKDKQIVDLQYQVERLENKVKNLENKVGE